MNYVPVVVAGTSSTNISGTKEVASQGVKNDVSSLRYIALPNWFHEAHMESSNSDAQDACNADVTESSGNSNPTAPSKIPAADQMELLIVESIIPTVSSPVPTTCLDTSLETSSGSRLISKEEEPKKIVDALKDPSWVEAMQEELLQFKIQNVWILVDCPKGMDVKSAFLYGTIDEEVYVMQPPRFQDPKFPDRVYKVEKAIHCLSESTEEISYFFKFLQKKDGIFLSQDKYVGDILKKFGYTDVRSGNTPMDKENPWGKDRPASSDTKECHLHAIKRIFRYLKGHPKLRLWYPKECSFDLVAYSYSDYGGATQDKKSTTGGCQFLGRRLISWKWKKHTIMATSTTKAEYVTAASGCRQVLWIQNQMLDYGEVPVLSCEYWNA
nr:hypothetical protein [Tanacetum cinerariifolium]